MSTQVPLILSLDVAGNPYKWIDYERAVYYYAKDLIAWQMGDGDYTLRGGTSRMTGERSTLDVNSIIAIKGLNVGNRLGRPPALSNRALFRRDKNLCAYCGADFTLGDLSRDHIHPRSKGGLDIWENVVTSCKSCNKHKSDRTPEEAKMPLLYVPYVPSLAEYLILQNRNILGDQMDFLMSRVPEHSRLHS